jgi:hypothetical protein
MLKVSSLHQVSAVVGTDTVPVVAPAGTVTNVCSSVIRTPAVPLVNTKVYAVSIRRVAQKLNTTSDPSVAEAGVIVATVGVSLSNCTRSRRFQAM